MSMYHTPPLGDRARAFPGWRTLLGVFSLYSASIAYATYPTIANFASAVPCSCTNDPMHLLFVMRWYKSCLLEGRLPFFCPDIQYPAGAPLAFFDPGRLQSLFYIVASAFTSSDVLCYNILFFFGFVATGMATFLLAWYVVRNRACACLAGLLAMLSTPMVSHGMLGHLVLIQVWCFPLFLITWMSFVDRPTRASLLGTLSTYVLLVMSAHYYVVMVFFPACLYVVWRWLKEGRAGLWPWLRCRAAWFAAFAALAVPCLLVLYSTHIWVMGRGYSMDRPVEVFDYFHAPPWAYLAPIVWQRINSALPINVYLALDPSFLYWSMEVGSYLGVVTLGLLAYAAVQRASFPRASFWWALFALLVVLSFGRFLCVGPYQVKLPGDLFWEAFFAFRYIRVPARFNLFVCVPAAVLAAAGLNHLLGRMTRRWMRAATTGLLILVAVADLSPAQPFPVNRLPAIPACYAEILRREPNATFLDVPVVGTAGSLPINAAFAYWQTYHRGRTSGGYGAHPNPEFEALHIDQSPFSLARMLDPTYLGLPEELQPPFLTGARFEDYVWLYLTEYNFDYVVLHHPSPELHPTSLPLFYDRIKARLLPAKVYEDQGTTVYARARMTPPTVPVALNTRGWANKHRLGAVDTWRLDGAAGLVVYNPQPDRGVTLSLQSLAVRGPKTVRVSRQRQELARWDVQPGVLTTYQTAPLRLPAGLSELTIETLGDEALASPRGEQIAGARPSLPPAVRVSSVALKMSHDEGAPVSSIAKSPGAIGRREGPPETIVK